MRFFFCDTEPAICSAIESEFKGKYELTIFNGLLSDCLGKFPIDAIVSPANGFGIMDGGYDHSITEWFGKDLQKDVQAHIIHKLRGEQPVGTSIAVPTKDPLHPWLIHTPTMRYPTRIVDSSVVYHCTRSSLLMADRLGVNSVLFPAFGGGCGCVPSRVIAWQMRLAFDQFFNPPEKITWDYVRTIGG